MHSYLMKIGGKRKRRRFELHICTTQEKQDMACEIHHVKSNLAILTKKNKAKLR